MDGNAPARECGGGKMMMMMTTRARLYFGEMKLDEMEEENLSLRVSACRDGRAKKDHRWQRVVLRGGWRKSRSG